MSDLTRAGIPAFREVYLGDTPSPRLSIGFGVNWNSPFGPFRVDIARAVTQPVAADVAAIDFPVQRWPHADDTPVTEVVGYRNTGSAPVTLTLAVAPAAPEAVVNIDPSQFEAAILNLAVNARDATPAGGMIRVETAAVDVAAGQIAELDPGDYLRVSVHDTGCGMDAATIARAFEPFFTTKPPGRGTGLGLSICYGIVEEHRGRIEVDSQPGRGSIFRVFLPVHS